MECGSFAKKILRTITEENHENCDNSVECCSFTSRFHSIHTEHKYKEY